MRVPVAGVRQTVLFVEEEVEEVLKRNWPSSSWERGAGIMLAREMGEARSVKQVAVQLCVVEAAVVAGMIVVVVRIVLVAVERVGVEGVAEAEVVGAGDVDVIVLREEIDGRLELAVLDSTVVVVNVEVDSTLEIGSEIEDVSVVTTEVEVGNVKDEPRV